MLSPSILFLFLHASSLFSLIEPTEDWKVEQVLHWWLLRAHSESEAEYEKLVDSLAQQLEDGKQELWEAHAEVTDLMRNTDTTNTNNPTKADVDMIEEEGNTTTNRSSSNNQKDSINIQNLNKSENVENRDPIIKPKRPVGGPATMAKNKVVTIAASAKDTRATTAAASNNNTDATMKSSKRTTTNTTKEQYPPPPDTIHLEVTSGPYAGNFYDLQPKARKYAWIGRSQGRKFKTTGMSLPQDLEVSTSHGRFEYSKEEGGGVTFAYLDVGSTNGSRIDGFECEPNTSYILSSGMTLVMGATTCKVTLLALA